MQAHKLYLQHGFKITSMHSECKFKPLRTKKTGLGINMNYELKVNMSLKLSVTTIPLRSASDTPDPSCLSNEYISL